MITKREQLKKALQLPFGWDIEEDYNSNMICVLDHGIVQARFPSTARDSNLQALAKAIQAIVNENVKPSC